jgi:hypothetical protein
MSIPFISSSRFVFPAKGVFRRSGFTIFFEKDSEKTDSQKEIPLPRKMQKYKKEGAFCRLCNPATSYNL